VETRRPVLRCGNGGWSGWIDEFGGIRHVMTNETGTVYFRGVRTLDVSRDRRWIERNSFYTEHGDWFVLVSAVLVVLSVMILKLAESATQSSRGPAAPRSVPTA